MLRRLAAHALGLLRRAPNCTFAGWVTLSFLVIAFAFARALNHNGVIFVVCGIGCTVLLDIP